MAQKRHVLHYRSNVTDASGLPKMPNASDLNYGEISVNFANGVETISLKNSSNEIVKFTPNTNVYVSNLNAAVSVESLRDILTLSNIYKYQDYNITYLKSYNGNFDLSGVISLIADKFYDSTNLHIMLNIAKGDADGRPTTFIVNTDVMNQLVNSGTKPISALSSIVNFTKYDIYFVAGDSTAMSGIEINWDATTKAITVRFVYLDSVYRLTGNEIN